MLGQLPSPSLSTNRLSGTPGLSFVQFFSLTYTCIESPAIDDVTMRIDVDMEAAVQSTDPEHSGQCGIILNVFLHCPQRTSSLPANRDQHTEGTSYQSQHGTTQPLV